MRHDIKVTLMFLFSIFYWVSPLIVVWQTNWELIYKISFFMFWLFILAKLVYTTGVEVKRKIQQKQDGD